MSTFNFFHVRGVFRIVFIREGAPNFVTFSSVVFSGRVNFKAIQVTKTTPGDSGGMLPRKFFENCHTVMVIIMLFEQFSGKFYLCFWSLILSASTNMMHFVGTVSIMRV